MALFYVIIQHNQIVGFQSASLSTAIPTTKDGSVYQVDIQNDQLIGLNLISLPLNLHPVSRSKDVSGPSECVKNITYTFSYTLDTLSQYTDITPQLVSKVLTQAFNSVGEENAKGAPRYSTTVRDCTTRRIGINTKAELVSLVYEYVTGKNTRLKDLLFAKYEKGTAEDINALTELFSQFHL